MLVYILTGLLFLALVYGFLMNFCLKTEYYLIESERAGCDKRLVLLTDLHGCFHGKENEKLIRRIREVNPDIVCIAGDMTVKDGKGCACALHLVGKLAENYPVFYAPGNHEIRMPDYMNYKEKLKDKGVHFLENEWADLADGYVIGGLDLSEYWYHKVYEKRNFTKEEMTKIMIPVQDAYPDRVVFPILLAHNPEYFPQYARWGAHLVLSGHIHGGIARLPFLGGVLSPSLRLFPTYDAGLFRERDRFLIVSRGLGLHHIRFRFFNRPELSVVDIRKKNR